VELNHPMDSSEFIQVLRASVSHWKQLVGNLSTQLLKVINISYFMSPIDQNILVNCLIKYKAFSFKTTHDHGK